MKLPRQGPVERYAQLRAALDRRAFLDELPGVAVLIRLDERGGDDEPAPWAFHGSGLPLPVDVPSTDEDVFLDRTRDVVPPDDSTLTGPTFSLSIPAARGRATVHVVAKQREVTIGRNPKCDVIVKERSVSKQHATLIVDGRGFEIIDMGSDNGIAVNAKRVPARGRAPIHSGDVLDLGDVSLLFLSADELWDGLPRLVDG